MKLKLTFYNTEPRQFQGGTIYHSTTPKKEFILEYNTTSAKRAFAFAKRKRKNIIRDNPELGVNTKLEFVENS